MLFDEIIERDVNNLVGTEEPISPITGVDQVVFAAVVGAVGERVSPDTVAKSHQECTLGTVRQIVLGLLSRYQT